jgi:hypothetical protein
MMMASITILLIATLLFASVGATAPPPVIAPSQAMNSLFDPRHNLDAKLHPPFEQFLGSDCDVSTKLNDRYTLFAFGDTLVGSFTGKGNNSRRVVDPYRAPPPTTMPHTSVGVFDSKLGKTSFFWGDNITSLFVIPGLGGEKMKYFWPSVITPMVNGTVCIVGERVDNITGTGRASANGWGFIVNGTYVVCLDHVLENVMNPRVWTQRWSRVPHTGNMSSWNYSYTIEWREALRYVQRDDAFYMFGNYKLNGQSTDHQILSKISRSDFHAFNWEKQDFYIHNGTINGGRYARNVWESVAGFDVTDLKPVWSGLGASIPEFTVEYSTTLQKYFVLFIPGFALSIQMRTSDRLEGPWTGNTTAYPHAVYQLPPYTKNIFCYALKFHATLDALLPPQGTQKSERRVFSYVCNANHIRTLFQDGYATVYTPRFMTLDLF